MGHCFVTTLVVLEHRLATSVYLIAMFAKDDDNDIFLFMCLFLHAYLCMYFFTFTPNFCDEYEGKVHVRIAIVWDC